MTDRVHTMSGRTVVRREDGTRLVVSRGPDGVIYVDVLEAGRPTRRLVDPQPRPSTGSTPKAPPEHRAPTTGVVRELLVRVGDVVVAGTALLRLEAMKTVFTVRAEADGVVESIDADVGTKVERGRRLVVLGPPR